MKNEMSVIRMWLQSRVTMMRSRYSPAVEEVAKLILSQQNWSVSESSGYVVLNNSSYLIRFWSGYTKFFAYMDSGMIGNKSKNQDWAWDECRPKRLTLFKVYNMIEALKKQHFVSNFLSVVEPPIVKEQIKEVVKSDKPQRMLRPISVKKWWRI
jgi:hypothetical protein